MISYNFRLVEYDIPPVDNSPKNFMYALSFFLIHKKKWDSSKNVINHKYYIIKYHCLPEAIVIF